MPQATAKPNCPYCGSGKTEVSEMYSVALGGVCSVLECSVCGCTQPLPRHVAKDDAKAKNPGSSSKEKLIDALCSVDAPECPNCGCGVMRLEEGSGGYALFCPSCKVRLPFMVLSGRERGAEHPASAKSTVSADLLRIAEDMEIRTELDESIGRATVRRWARGIRAAAENAG